MGSLTKNGFPMGRPRNKEPLLPAGRITIQGEPEFIEKIRSLRHKIAKRTLSGTVLYCVERELERRGML